MALTDAYHIGFRAILQAPANKSAYIDDVHYAAIESPGATSVVTRQRPNHYAHADVHRLSRKRPSSLA